MRSPSDNRTDIPDLGQSNAIRPFREIEYRLRAEASLYMHDRPMAVATMREAAEYIGRMRSCFNTLQRAAENEGYDVLINIDGTEVSLRRRDDC